MNATIDIEAKWVIETGKGEKCSVCSQPCLEESRKCYVSSSSTKFSNPIAVVCLKCDFLCEVIETLDEAMAEADEAREWAINERDEAVWSNAVQDIAALNRVIAIVRKLIKQPKP